MKNLLLTGASGGIGSEIAQYFSSDWQLLGTEESEYFNSDNVQVYRGLRLKH